tara:strand:+ start:288 stop:587 length:300 start_codon:yes stop_codon:yes gene_type:complete
MWTIRWTSTAIQSVNEVSDFVETIWGSKIANHFLDLVDEKIVLIGQNPEIGFSEIKLGLKSILVHKNVRLFYKVMDSEIVLLLFWDVRQNPEELEKKLT